MKNKKAKREKVAKVARVPIMLEKLLENIVKLARRGSKVSATIATRPDIKQQIVFKQML